MLVRRLSLIVVSFVLLTVPAHAGLLERTQAEELVHAYMEAMTTEGLGAVGPYIDPEQLGQLRDLLMPLFQGEDASTQAQMLAIMFPGQELSLGQLGSVAPDEWFSAFIRLLGVSGQPLPTVEGGRILGSVRETGELIHVVVRANTVIADTSISTIDVVPVRCRGGRCRIGLKADLLAAAQAMSAAAGGR
ncbi:MAG: hypothetical protein AAF533_25320 [Acidobacteriota bacterium]